MTSASAHDLASAPQPLPLLLRELRAARFSSGLRCPRCSGLHVQRWGSFSGRQRYRCRHCRRTFSDLTGTPAAYIKKLALWPAFLAGMPHGESLRAAAHRLGIHPSTAFRWRHRLLDGLRSLDHESLTGWVELAVFGGYPHSCKGQRSGLGRPPRSRALFRPGLHPTLPRSWILMACDRLGHVVTGLVPHKLLRSHDLERVLGTRLRGRSHGRGPVLLTPQWNLQPFRRFLDRRPQGGSVYLAWGPHARHPLIAGHHRPRTYWFRLRRWIRRFRGVATRYLPNYLLWHRSLDRSLRLAFPPSALRWPGAGPPHP